MHGSAGRGYVVDTPGVGASLVVTDLKSLPADKLYELWLLDAAGTPLLARITQRSWNILGLAPGSCVWAQVKTVVLIG